MSNSLDRSCTENQNTLYVHFFSPENLTVYEIMCKNMIEAGRPLMTIRRMCFACWINEATNTESEYVILIALPRQQWLRERASLLPDSSLASLVIFY
jgi:hypothetical protein